jgi:hypothetical protein
MFYNPLVGGLQGAERRYEMDYWVNMMPEAVNALQDYLGLAQEKSRRLYTVGVCGEKFSFHSRTTPTSASRRLLAGSSQTSLSRRPR